MPKVRQAELSFLYVTRPLVLFYISAKCHQNIPKGIPVTVQTRNLFQNKTKGDNSKSKKARVVILVHGIFIWSCSTFLPSIIKIFQ